MVGNELAASPRKGAFFLAHAQYNTIQCVQVIALHCIVLTINRAPAIARGVVHHDIAFKGPVRAVKGPRDV